MSSRDVRIVCLQPNCIVYETDWDSEREVLLVVRVSVLFPYKTFS